MDDLISRQAAIKAIDDLPNCYNGYSDTYDKSCIIGVLEELPTAEPRWIPVSERLPEEGEGVLWCTRGGYVCSGCVMLGHPIDDCGHQGNYIAWMPLPEPYKGGEK